MAGDERGDRRREMARAERRRQVMRSVPRGTIDADVTATLGFLEVGQKLHAALVERLAALRQRQPPRRAVEQPHVEMRFELGNLPRDRRDRDAETLRGAREAARLDDAGEGGMAWKRSMAASSYYCI